MPLLHAVFLVLHIIAGGLALLTGLIPMIVTKGNDVHRSIGIVYSLAMLVVFITAVMLSTTIPWINGTPINTFLLAIGVFSYYFVFTGRRSLKNFRLPYKKLPGMQDKLASLLLLYVSGFLLVSEAMAKGIAHMNIIVIIFGAAGAFIALFDLYTYYAGFDRIKHDKEWFFRHMIRMLASYIAAFTAFVVVNVNFLPPLVVWVMPGVIGGIGITVWTRYYRKKFATEKL